MDPGGWKKAGPKARGKALSPGQCPKTAPPLAPQHPSSQQFPQPAQGRCISSQAPLGPSSSPPHFVVEFLLNLTLLLAVRPKMRSASLPAPLPFQCLESKVDGDSEWPVPSLPQGLLAFWTSVLGLG